MLPDFFFTINFSISIMMSLATVTVSFIMIVLYITQQRCHSITNLLTSNTSVFIALYSLGNLVSSVFGLRQDWAEDQPACIFRAYIHKKSPDLSVCLSVRNAPKTRISVNVLGKTQKPNNFETCRKGNRGWGIRIRGQISILELS